MSRFCQIEGVGLKPSDSFAPSSLREQHASFAQLVRSSKHNISALSFLLSGDTSSIPESIRHFAQKLRTLKPIHRCQPDTLRWIAHTGYFLTRDDLDRLQVNDLEKAGKILGELAEAWLRVRVPKMGEEEGEAFIEFCTAAIEHFVVDICATRKRRDAFSSCLAIRKLARETKKDYKTALGEVKGTDSAELKAAHANGLEEYDDYKKLSEFKLESDFAEFSDYLLRFHELAEHLLSSGKPIGSNAPADRMIGTSSTVFGVVGPHPYKHNGPVHLVLNRCLLNHPNSDLSVNACTSFYSGVTGHFRPWACGSYLSDTEVLDQLVNCALGATGAPSLEKPCACLQYYSKSTDQKSRAHAARTKVSPDDDFYLDVAVDFALQYWLRNVRAKGPPLVHAPGVEELWSYYMEYKNPHGLIEAHLPSVIPVALIDHIIITKETETKHPELMTALGKARIALEDGKTQFMVDRVIIADNDDSAVVRQKELLKEKKSDSMELKTHNHIELGLCFQLRGLQHKFLPLPFSAAKPIRELEFSFRARGQHFAFSFAGHETKYGEETKVYAVYVGVHKNTESYIKLENRTGYRAERFISSTGPNFGSPDDFSDYKISIDCKDGSVVLAKDGQSVMELKTTAIMDAVRYIYASNWITPVDIHDMKWWSKSSPPPPPWKPAPKPAAPAAPKPAASKPATTEVKEEEKEVVDTPVHESTVAPSASYDDEMINTDTQEDPPTSPTTGAPTTGAPTTHSALYSSSAGHPTKPPQSALYSSSAGKSV